jgi:hypothetical protein
MGAPREVARSGQTGRDGKVTMRMRTTLLINTSCFTHTDPLPSHPRVACLCMQLRIVKGCSDKDCGETENDSGTDTEAVESFLPNFVSLLCRYVV